MSTPAVLAQHIDTADNRHRLVALDPRRLRCLDCSRTLVITQPSGSTSTSQSPIPGPGEPRCPQHQHEHADGCRTCAADAKGRPDDAPPIEHQPTADVAARAAEARAVLPARRPEPRRTAADPERMAQARAELDAAFPRIQLESEADDSPADSSRQAAPLPGEPADA